MIKLSIILSLLISVISHLTGPGMAYAPVQDSYRVEVLRARVKKANVILEWAIRNGVNVNEMEVWK
uniref:Uncharacterized protein n=1 Tax=viral metagenome TaxID=1070528 RepID=A0A6M3JM62_9ZZZZ